MGWQVKLALVVRARDRGRSCCRSASKFPPTERKAAGVSMGEMFRELLNPLFFVLFCSMFLTAASELAPGQWVDFALSRTVHMPGILLLVYVSGLMFVMRHFAGPLVHRLSSIGLLWVSCLLASLGLVALSFANSPVTGLLAATLWGTGVCYMWPTMLATASERFPRGGALLMGLMGTAGMLSIQFVLPLMGRSTTQEGRGRRRRGRVRRASAGTRARPRPGHRGADLVPRRGHLPGHPARGLRRHLADRSVARRIQGREDLLAPALLPHRVPPPESGGGTRWLRRDVTITTPQSFPAPSARHLKPHNFLV